MGLLGNKVAIVTGGTCSLGLAIVQAYAREAGRRLAGRAQLIALLIQVIPSTIAVRIDE